MRLSRIIEASRVRLIWAVIAGLVILLRVEFPPRDLETTGIQALRDLVLTLSWWIIILLLSYALGQKILTVLSSSLDIPYQNSLYSWGLGLGTIAYGVLTLTLAGLLTKTAISLLLLCLSFLLGADLHSVVKSIPASFGGLLSYLRRSGPFERLLTIAAILILILTLCNALAPPWDYDGLKHNLVGPKLFLEYGKFIADPDNWAVNGPATPGMLFTLGLTFGDDTFSKLIHLTFGFLFVMGIALLARTLFSAPAGWFSLAAILSIPVLPSLASFAYVDLAWSFFELLALSTLLFWAERRETSYLLLMGIFLGLAAGTKYLALGTLVIGVGLVFVLDLKQGARKLFRDLFCVTVPAILIAAPWYIKNWILLQNPVFPFYFGGLEWDRVRLQSLDAFHASFGMGSAPQDYLLLLPRLYLYPNRFGTVFGDLDMPGLLMPLALIFPFFFRHSQARILVLYTLGRAGLWIVGSQQTRFLLPIEAPLALMAGAVLTAIAARLNSRWKQITLTAIVLSLVVAVLLTQTFLTVFINPLPSILGLESKASILSRTIKPFQSYRLTVAIVPEGHHVILLGDGRGYYCQPKCIPDPEEYRWAREIAGLPSIHALSGWFDSHTATHIMLNWEDLKFLLEHDTDGVLQIALDRLYAWRDTGCLQEVFLDRWVEYYEVKCEP